jgi:hydrogenase nickel incorporation protein HypA/HybF
MHELSLCESILQIVEEEAQRQGFTRVKQLRLEIGRLSGVEIEAMRFGFEVVSRDSILQGAQLQIIELPGKGWCMACAEEVEVQQRFDACACCGGFQVQVTAGEEMRIKDLEVE